MSSSRSTYSFSITVDSTASFSISNFSLPAYEGGFNRDKFWEKFVAINHCSGEEALIELVLDITRGHYSPKPESWPGMTVVVTKSPGDTFQIDLPAGKMIAQPFHRGKGKIYTWTRSNLATAAVFHQVFASNKGCKTNEINGNYKGYTQFCSTIEGFTEDNYKQCVRNFKTWLATVGLPGRDTKIDTQVETATLKAIVSRTKDSSAYSLVNILRFCTGGKFDPKDQISVAI